MMTLWRSRGWLWSVSSAYQQITPVSPQRLLINGINTRHPVRLTSNWMELCVTFSHMAQEKNHSFWSQTGLGLNPRWAALWFWEAPHLTEFIHGGKNTHTTRAAGRCRVHACKVCSYSALIYIKKQSHDYTIFWNIIISPRGQINNYLTKPVSTVFVQLFIIILVIISWGG